MKLSWSGTVVGIQPRIRLLRSFDQRAHTYLGYALRVDGEIDGDPCVFVVGIGRGAQSKRALRAGDAVRGLAERLVDPRKEAIDLYKVSRLQVQRQEAEMRPGPPFLSLPPALEEYRARGHRRLAARTYAARCQACLWGCQMAVEVIRDHWNPRESTSWRRVWSSPKSLRTEWLKRVEESSSRIAGGGRREGGRDVAAGSVRRG